MSHDTLYRRALRAARRAVVYALSLCAIIVTFGAPQAAATPPTVFVDAVDVTTFPATGTLELLVDLADDSVREAVVAAPDRVELVVDGAVIGHAIASNETRNTSPVTVVAGFTHNISYMRLLDRAAVDGGPVDLEQPQRLGLSRVLSAVASGFALGWRLYDLRVERIAGGWVDGPRGLAKRYTRGRFRLDRPTADEPQFGYGVARLMEEFKLWDAALPARRVVVMLTDGSDILDRDPPPRPTSFYANARTAANALGVRLMFVGLAVDENSRLDRVRDYAQMTGGSYREVTLAQLATDPDAVSDALVATSDRLHRETRLTFKVDKRYRGSRGLPVGVSIRITHNGRVTEGRHIKPVVLPERASH